MIHLVVTHIGQSLDLKSKSFIHTLTLQLPNGVAVQATVDERAVEAMMQMVAEGAPPASEPPPQQTNQAESEFVDGLYEGQPAHVFGGAPEPTEEEDQGQQMQLPPPQQQQTVGQPRLIRPPQPVRIRTVPKDEMGNPVVAPSGVDAGQVLGEALDDDGVPQI